MGNSFYFDFEVKLILFLQNNIGSLGLLIAKMFTMLGNSSTAVVFIGVFYFAVNKQLGKNLCTAVLMAIDSTSMIKNIFLRRRPYYDIEEIKCLMAPESGDINDLNVQGFSFPSGHASTTLSEYITIADFYKNNKLMIIGLITAACVGISRFVVGAHFPTDVLAGWLVSLISLFVIKEAKKKYDNEQILFVMIFVFLAGILYCTSKDYYDSFGLTVGAFFAFKFEKEKVNFKNAGNILNGVIRVAGGAITFLLVTTILKILPFNDFMLYSSFRYALGLFVSFGIYPMCFKYLDEKI